MKRYINHLKNTRTPHERRIHALQISGVVTALLFVGWAGTLSWRFSETAVAQNSDNQTTLPQGEQANLSASAAQAQQNNQAHLEVSTTSVFLQ